MNAISAAKGLLVDHTVDLIIRLDLGLYAKKVMDCGYLESSCICWLPRQQFQQLFGL